MSLDPAGSSPRDQRSCEARRSIIRPLCQPGRGMFVYLSMRLMLLAALALPLVAQMQRIDLVFTGGHETDPRDHGRPDVLIAAAMGVPTEVFREAFSHVTPAREGHPSPEEAQRNKAALLRTLGPHGLTNERIDEVSNYYRYNRRAGQEVWRSTPATGYATVKDGVVTGVTITDPGSGYSSEPTVSVPGMPQVRLAAKLAFGKEFSRNGSIVELAVSGAK